MNKDNTDKHVKVDKVKPTKHTQRTMDKLQFMREVSIVLPSEEFTN